MTTWTPTSEVSQGQRAAGKKPVAVSAETFDVIERAQDIAKKSAACSTSRRRVQGHVEVRRDMDGTLPDPKDVKKRLGADRLQGHRPRQEEEDGLPQAQGHVDHARRHREGLRSRQVLRAAQEGRLQRLHAAGRRRHVHRGRKKGSEPWQVGIRDPRGRTELFAGMPIENHSFSTSGDYERGFVKTACAITTSSIPRDGQPARASRSVTIRARTRSPPTRGRR
jgi:thiamine biosynthesis lipoprotein